LGVSGGIALPPVEYFYLLGVSPMDATGLEGFGFGFAVTSGMARWSFNRCAEKGGRQNRKLPTVAHSCPELPNAAHSCSGPAPIKVAAELRVRS
jgi:hypothetical protein